MPHFTTQAEKMHTSVRPDGKNTKAKLTFLFPFVGFGSF